MDGQFRCQEQALGLKTSTRAKEYVWKPEPDPRALLTRSISTSRERHEEFYS